MCRVSPNNYNQRSQPGAISYLISLEEVRALFFALELPDEGSNERRVVADEVQLYNRVVTVPPPKPLNLSCWLAIIVQSPIHNAVH